MLAIGDCSGEACPLPLGALPYGSAPAGNAFVLAAFAALTLPVLYAGLRYGTFVHSLLLLAALLLEIVGHIGKALLAGNPASRTYAAAYLMGTHWGAVLVGSSLNLVLPHVLVIYGQDFQLVTDPAHVNIVLFVLDIFALVFQSTGIGLASSAPTATTEVSVGLYILLAGLGIQALSLLAFLGTYRYFRHKLEHRRYILDDRWASVYLSQRFKNFMLCVQVAALLVLARTAVRIAIFANGLTSTFARSQVASFLLDDVLILIAAIILVAYPAGHGFGHTAWAETSPITPFFSSSDRTDQHHNPPHPHYRPPHLLPLRLRRGHRRNRSSYQINKRVISLPYPSPSTSPRFSPGITIRAGLQPGLPAHPSPRGIPPPPLPPAPAPTAVDSPPLTSPRNNPVHQRGAVPFYDSSPTQVVPFLDPQESPGLDSQTAAMWGAVPVEGHTPGSAGRKRKLWGGGGGGGGGGGAGQDGGHAELVDADAIW